MKRKCNKEESKKEDQSAKKQLNEDLPKSKQLFINKEIVKYIASNSQPYNLIESRAFIRFIQTIIPGFQPMSRTWATNTAIPELFSDVKNKLATDLKNATSVSLTCDVWTSDVDQQYLGVTAHYILPDWTLESKTLCIKHISGRTIADNLTKILEQCMVEFEIRAKVLSCVTDNGKNMANAVVNANLANIHCFDHSLQLAVNEALDGHPPTILSCVELQTLIFKAKSIAAAFHKNVVLMDKLREHQISKGVAKPLKLKQEVKTRWNSTFKMLDRLIELYEHIRPVLAAERTHIEHLFSSTEVLLAKHLLQVLRPICYISEQAEKDKEVTISLIPAFKSAIRNKFCYPNANDLPPISLFKSNLSAGVGRRILSEETERENIYYAARLDPRMKDHMGQFTAEEKAQWDANLIGETTEETEEQTGQISNLPKDERTKAEYSIEIFSTPTRRVADEELARYDNEPPIKHCDNPLEWWKHHEHKFPKLSKLAKTYLAIPATSIPADRVFSLSGNQMLKPDNVEMLTFLKKNME